MNEDKDEIRERWRGLEDVQKEHTLFRAYLEAREVFLRELRDIALSKGTRERAAQLKTQESLAFDAYAEHRSTIDRRQPPSP